MSKKVLVPVLPTDRFYDAVVAAGQLLGQERGGLVVFLFTEVRPPPLHFEKEGSGRPDLDEVTEDSDDQAEPPELEEWRMQQVQGLDEARALLHERGIDERNIEYAFADYSLPRAEAIAEAAAAGGFDAVMLPAGFVSGSAESFEREPPDAIPEALRELDEVRVYVV